MFTQRARFIRTLCFEANNTFIFLSLQTFIVCKVLFPLIHNGSWRCSVARNLVRTCWKIWKWGRQSWRFWNVGLAFWMCFYFTALWIMFAAACLILWTQPLRPLLLSLGNNVVIVHMVDELIILDSSNLDRIDYFQMISHEFDVIYVSLNEIKRF